MDWAGEDLIIAVGCGLIVLTLLAGVVALALLRSGAPDEHERFDERAG